MSVRIAPPASDEYADFHRGYVSLVAHEPDAVELLERQSSVLERLRSLTPEQASHRYAAGKWTVKELIGHLSDAERVVSYRLLRIARGDRTPLPGFDEQAYAANAGSEARGLSDLVNELMIVRSATVALVRSLDERVLANRGRVNDWSLTVRGLVFIIAGHVAHHLKILNERYGIDVLVDQAAPPA
jgi:hypothetical protein